MISNHEIEYCIFGEEMQYVEVELDPGETVIAEPGAFMMRNAEIRMPNDTGRRRSTEQPIFLSETFLV